MRADGRGRAGVGLALFLVVLGSLAVRPALAARHVFLWFADGGTPPASVRKTCQGTPPAFVCPLGAVAACRDPIYVLLDRWYADFDVVFSYAPPVADVDGGSVAYDTVVIANEGTWCAADPRSVTRSPVPTCNDPGAGGAVAVFRCGSDAKQCATYIAKEQAHLVGLQHTGSPTDVMNELGGTDHDGFEDRDNLSDAPRCGRLQNSYRLMLERTGPWAGGAKPGPGEPLPPNFPAPPDAAPPAPEDAADEADAPVAVADANALPDVVPKPPRSEADGSMSTGADGGCSCQLGRRQPSSSPSSLPALATSLAALIVAGAQVRRRRRVRAHVSGTVRGNRNPNQA
jgi:hypothetical protein